MSGPLAGYRILDFGRFELGPLSAVWLSDLGADVIKVETRTGDPVRGPHPKSIPIVLAHNRGKRSIAIDFRKPEGRAAVLKLAETADVVMHNFRGGVMEAMGLGYDDFREVNRRIVYAAATAFGPEGPRKHDPGNDTIGQAAGGLAYATGVPGGDPIVAGAAIADAIGAYALMSAVLAALLERERSEEGQYVETSLYGTQIALQSWEIGWHAMSGEMPVRNGAYPYLAGWGIFGTQDGALAVGGIGDVQWPKFCALIGQPEYGERWPTAMERGENQDAVADVIRTALRERENAYWLEELPALDIVVAAVQSYADIIKDPQARENGYIIDLDYHGGRGTLPGPGNPWTFMRTRVEPGRRAPELGEHTEAVLLEAGSDWEQIADLQSAGVIGFETDS